jgi:hypothetical protein
VLVPGGANARSSLPRGRAPGEDGSSIKTSVRVTRFTLGNAYLRPFPNYEKVELMSRASLVKPGPFHSRVTIQKGASISPPQSSKECREQKRAGEPARFCSRHSFYAPQQAARKVVLNSYFSPSELAS